MIKIKTALFGITNAFVIPMVFNPGKAGWKMTEDGKSIEMKNGNPVWLEADGTEKVLQQDTITRLNTEAAGHRQKAEQLQATVDKFKDIDPDKARAAIETVAKINQKQLIDAGEVDKVRAQISGEYENKIAEKDKAYTDLEGRYNGMRVDNIFATSEFVRDQIAIPQDMFQAYFRNNFKPGPNGTIEAFDKAGNRVMSKQKIGEFADPTEALEILVNQHPQKDVIVKPSNHSGSGNNGGGGNRAGQRIIKRNEFDQLTPAQQAETAGKARTGEVTIVD